MSRVSGLQYSERAKEVFPGGVNSNVRLDVADIFFDHGTGSHLWDVDGRQYIDYLLGQGPAFLGHAFEPVRAAVGEALGKGVVFGAQTVTETLAGEAVIRAVRWADRLRFSMTGTESVQAALRVARAYTGRNTFIRFRGHYHGWLDNVLADFSGSSSGTPGLGQDPRSFGESIALEWNDIDALRAALDDATEGVAAVIMEPMMLNAGAVLPRPGYLEAVRQLCSERDVALIFDETITGFRVALGGCAELFGVQPDLAIYGKAMGGGYPAAALVGRAEMMDLFANGVNHSGTFNANLPACAAVKASIDSMTGNDTQVRVEAIGLTLQSGLRDLFASMKEDITIRGVGSAFHLAYGGPDEVLNYTDLLAQDAPRYRRLVPHLHEAGLWVASRGIWYVSAAHTLDDVSDTLDRVDAALRAQSRN